MRVCPRRLEERTEDEDCEPGQIKPTDELQRKQSLLKTGADAQRHSKLLMLQRRFYLSIKFPFPLTEIGTATGEHHHSPAEILQLFT